LDGLTIKKIKVGQAQWLVPIILTGVQEDFSSRLVGDVIETHPPSQPTNTGLGDACLSFQLLL
jgi:hypothetical protein